MWISRGLLLTALCSALHGQTSTSIITGTVSDAQGARVPGVKVTAVHADTNISYSAASSEDGAYAIPSLPVGVFQVSASHPGFRTFQRDNVLVEVAQRLRVDIVLELGQITETVTVSADVARVQAEDSSISTVVENQRIEELPLNGRNVFSLLTIVAGVQPRLRGNDGFADQDITGVRINGGPYGGNQILMDGGVNTTSAKGLAVVPQADSVREFRVETNSMKAEYGQTTGGMVNVVTKSGTNRVHGSAYEFLRNDALDARNAFLVTPDLTGRVKPVVRYHQFGGTVGGPVWIPKMYNGRNRTFFYFGKEQWLYSNATVMRATLPAALERTGDFSNTRDARGALIAIYDPATTRANPSGNGVVRDAFARNQIPQNRLDPVAQNILKYIPLPNVPADNPYTNTNNWLFIGGSPLDMGTTSLKADHRFGDADSGFFRFSDTRSTRVGRGYGFGVADPNTLARNDQRDRHNWTAGETHIFTPNLINEFRANASRFHLDFRHPSYGGGWPQKLGMPSSVPADLFPSLSITGVTALGPTSIAQGLQAEHTIQFVDGVTWVRGRHTFKAGTDHRFIRTNFIRTRYPSGQYQFSTTLNSNPQQSAGTGVGTATFLLGQVTGGELRIQPAFSLQSWTNGSYFQDDWKVTPRLTLNLGLRYDVSAPPVERWNRHSNFDPYLPSSATGMPGALVYSGAEAPREFVNWDRNNFGPRVGLAYAVNPRTVVRAAYGMLYVPVEGGDASADKSNALGFEAITTFSSTSVNTAAFPFRDGPPLIIQPRGVAGGPSAFRGQTVRYQDRNAPTPYLQQWNLTLQRQFGARWIATVSYTGNHGVKLFGANYDLNQLDPRYFTQGLALQNQVANPYAGRIPGALGASTIQRSQLLRPFPDYPAVNAFANHGASSAYHALQATVERRFSSGLSALVAYTNSKLINESTSSAGPQADTLDDFRIGAYNRRLDRALDENDISQRLVASGICHLPVGRGKRFLGGTRGIADHFIGGWQVNTVTTVQSGSPLEVRGGSNFTGIAYPNVLSNPALPASERTVARWFDTGAFRNPPDFTIGNSPRSLPATRGPGMFTVNFSAFKSFRIREEFRFEFRAEFFNFLNHVNLNDPAANFTANAQGLNSSSTFGRISSAMDARRSQLALRLVF